MLPDALLQVSENFCLKLMEETLYMKRWKKV